MKAPLHKNTALLSAFAACASILLFSQPAKAGPPFYRSGSGSRVSIGFYSGPSFRCGPGYGPGFGYGPGYGYSRYYCPPAYAYPVAPVYVAPPVYSAPVYTAPAPVYQGLPVHPSSYSNYQQLAPSGSHIVAHVQEKLRTYGYYRGPVDGVAGPGTRSAIRTYQVDRGIQVTGRVDQELLSDLGL
jgi:hypothetical protein